MGFIQDFGAAVGKTIDVEGLANSLFDKVWPWVQNKINEETPKVETWAEQKVDEVVDKYTPIVIEKLLGMMPTMVASAAKVVVEEAFKGIPNLPNVVLPDVAHIAEQVVDHVIDSDPDIPGLSDIIDLSELFKKWRGQ